MKVARVAVPIAARRLEVCILDYYLPYVMNLLTGEVRSEPGKM